MASLIVSIFRIISFSRLGLEMVRYHGYCSNVSQGKRKNKIKMNGYPPSWKLKDHQEHRKTWQGLSASGGLIQKVYDRAIA